MLLVVAFGVIVSTGLLSSAPILINTVIELGLPRRLRAADPADAHLRFSTFENLGEIDFRDVDESLQVLIQQQFAGHLDQIVLSISTHWAHPWLDGSLLPDERINFRRFDDLENQVHFISGSWPETAILMSDPEGLPVYRVVIGEAMAQWYGLDAGDRLPLSLKPAAAGPDLVLEIAAVVRAKDPIAPYWMGSFSPLSSQANQRYVQQFSVIVPAVDFESIRSALFPRSNSELAWHVILDVDSIKGSDLAGLINVMEGLPKDIGSTVAFQSGLKDLLLDFYTQAQGIRTPLYLLTAEVVLLALVYVVMTAGLAVRSIEREFAVLRSRGAARSQIVRIQLAEAGLIAAIAWLSGPGLGSILVRFLGQFGPLADLAGPAGTAAIPDAAWSAAFFGAASGLAGLLLPVGPALRRSIVAQVQTTGRERQPIWQRLYLDVMLLAAGLILMLRFQYSGGLASGRVDWLLLLSPITLLLGAATLVVRIAPPVLGFASRLAAAGRGLSAPLAFWHTARNPGQFTGLVILLTLANALGILATGLNATLNASEFERAVYASGSDYRLASERPLSAADFSGTANVAQVVGVWRESATVNLKTYRSFPSFEMLAIDPQRFTEVTVYRHDFSEQPMGEILGTLLAEADLPGIPLPGEPGEIGLWVFSILDRTDVLRARLDGITDRDRVGFFVKLITAGGESLLLELNPPAPGWPDSPDDYVPWVYVSAVLPEFSAQDYPLTLHSLWLRNRARSEGSFTAEGARFLQIDDIQVRDRAGGDVTIVEGFEDPLQIVQHELRANPDPISQFTYSRIYPHSGEALAKITLSYTRILADIGVVFHIADREDALIPAVVSESFLSATDLEVGDQVDVFVAGQAVVFQIRGVVRYFPTLYENGSAGFMITSSQNLLTRLSNATSEAFSFNELLVDTDGPIDPVDLAARSRSEITRIWSLEGIRQLIKADPMALGLRGVTYLGYFLTSLLSVIGFMTFFYLSLRQRAQSFGILRAMGMSPRQLYLSLAVEQSLVILTGLVLGAVLGAVLNDLVLPGLPVTLAAQLSTPPFLPRSDWRSVLQVFITLLALFSLTFGLATWALWRSRIHEALRYE